MSDGCSHGDPPNEKTTDIDICRSLPAMAVVCGRIVGLLVCAASGFGCGPTPEQLVQNAEIWLQSRDWARLKSHLDTEYTDPLGDRDRLMRDLADLDRDHPDWLIRWSQEGYRTRTTALFADVEARLNARLRGQPEWRIEGTMTVSLHQSDRWRVQGGLLTDLRDIRGLMAERRAALEANDVEGLTALLHPAYRDGLIDRDEAAARLARDVRGTAIRLRPSLYRVDVRPDLAHVDEHYRMSINGQEQPAAVAGMTLRKTAGRWRIAGGLY